MFTNERLFTIQAFTITRVHCTYLVIILKALIVWAAVNRGNKIWGAFFLIGLSLCKTRQEKKSNNLHFCSKAQAYTYFKETVNDQSCILTILFAKILMPCPFTGPKMFWASLHFLCQTKRWFAFSKIGFFAGTKGFEEALNTIKFLDWLKTFLDL